jgi:hypothetical protein
MSEGTRVKIPFERTVPPTVFISRRSIDSTRARHFPGLPELRCVPCAYFATSDASGYPTAFAN